MNAPAMIEQLDADEIEWLALEVSHQYVRDNLAFLPMSGCQPSGGCTAHPKSYGRQYPMKCRTLKQLQVITAAEKRAHELLRSSRASTVVEIVGNKPHARSAFADLPMRALGAAAVQRITDEDRAAWRARPMRLFSPADVATRQDNPATRISTTEIDKEDDDSKASRRAALARVCSIESLPRDDRTLVLSRHSTKTTATEVTAMPKQKKMTTAEIKDALFAPPGTKPMRGTIAAKKAKGVSGRLRDGELPQAYVSVTLDQWTVISGSTPLCPSGDRARAVTIAKRHHIQMTIIWDGHVGTFIDLKTYDERHADMQSMVDRDDIEPTWKAQAIGWGEVVAPKTRRAPREKKGSARVIQVNADRAAKDALRGAFAQLLSDRVELRGDGYYLKTRRGTMKPAAWSTIVQLHFDSIDAFKAAAEAWKSPKNMKTWARHA